MHLPISQPYQYSAPWPALPCCMLQIQGYLYLLPRTSLLTHHLLSSEDVPAQQLQLCQSLRGTPSWAPPCNPNPKAGSDLACRKCKIDIGKKAKSCLLRGLNTLCSHGLDDDVKLLLLMGSSQMSAHMPERVQSKASSVQKAEPYSPERVFIVKPFKYKGFEVCCRQYQFIPNGY